jgi:hypothetical protein
MRTLPRLALLTILLVAVGCAPTGEEPVPTGPVSLQLSGTFALHSVNGATLPADLTNNAQQRIEVLDDIYTLRSDLTFSRVRTLRTSTPPSAPATVTTFTSPGTYVAETTSITFNGSTSTGTFVTFAARNGVDLVVTLSQTQQTLVYKPR